MNILMYIFTGLYLVGIIIGRGIHAINDNTYFVCIGLWAIMFILLTIVGERNERW